MTFSRLPSEAVLPNDTVAKVVKKIAKVQLDRGPRDIDRLRHVASGIRPEVMARALHLLSGIDVRSFVRLVRGSHESVVLRTGYFYSVEDTSSGKQARLYKEDSMICSGSTPELFVFAMEHHPGAAKVIVASLQSGDQYVKLPKRHCVDVVDALMAYRQCRKKSKGLDFITKLAQYSHIDYDHDCLKFLSANYLCDGPIAVLGSGALGSTHTCFDIPVELVDPLIPYDGEESPECYDRHLKRKWEDLELENYEVIISDVSSGDSSGLLPRTVFNPPPDFQGIIITKVDFQDNKGPPGRLIRKPRPHNSEAVWEVDFEGPTWASQLSHYRRQLIDANERRMEKFFQLTGTEKIMDYPYGSPRLDHIAYRPYQIPPIPASMKIKQQGSPSLLLTSKDRRARTEKFTSYLSKFDQESFDRLQADPSDWCLLPREYIICGGTNRLDPGIGTVPFSAHSVLLSAAFYGFSLFRTTSSWLVRPPVN